MKPTMINERWMLNLPDHRAARPEWPWWEKERLDYMFLTIRPGNVIYDIGTEEGDLSALFAGWAEPGGEIHLFEPNPKVWPNIRAIFEGNDIPKPAACTVGFVGPKTEGEGTVYGEWPECAYGPLIGNHGFENLSERTKRPVVCLDDYILTHNPPDVITMDVEGSEFEVVKGAQRLLTEFCPTIFMSVHPEFMVTQYHQYQGELWKFLKDLDYIPTFIAFDHEQHWMWRSKYAIRRREE